LADNSSVIAVSLSELSVIFVLTYFLVLVLVAVFEIFLPARHRPQGLVVIGVCLSVRAASAQVCVPLGHSSLYFSFSFVLVFIIFSF